MARKPKKPQQGLAVKMIKPWSRFKDRTTRERYLAAIGNDASQSLACDYAGVSENTVRGWIRFGQDAMEKLEAHQAGEAEPLEDWEQEYLEFYAQVLDARSESDMKLVEIIKLSSAKDWKAASYLLSKRRKEYNDKTVLDVTTNNTTYMKSLNGTLTLDDEGLTDAEAIRIFLEESQRLEEQYNAENKD